MAIFNDPKKHSGGGSDRTAGDRQRHRQKVRQAIRDNIGDIIAEESIIGKDKNRIIKVPIKGIKEYRFVYGDNSPGVGQGGDGEPKPGDVIGQGKDGQGSLQAGDKPGVDYYETDVNLEELIDLMFEDLELPDMDKKALREIEVVRKFKRKGIKRKGIKSRLHKKRTQIEHIKDMQSGTRGMDAIRNDIAKLRREGRTEEAQNLEKNLREREKELQLLRAKLDQKGSSVGRRKNWIPMKTDNKRFFRTVEDIRKESNAVVLCIMDTSGSMDRAKKYLARSFFFLLYQFVKTRYQNVEIVFIAHHTEAFEVTEDEFFHKGESGGTFISSGYNKASEIIEKRYPTSLWNVYAFHCSDGDNFDSDNPAALQSAVELCKACNLFGYGEIKPLGAGYYGSSMIQFFSQIQEPNFQTVQIQKKEDIWSSFKQFLAKDRVKEDA